MNNLINKRNIFSKKDIPFYCFLLLYSIFLIYLCYELNIWVDETYTLNTTSRSLGDAIKQAYYFEAQLPLYFALLSLWRYISSDMFFARLFSLIFVFLTAWLFLKVVKLISGKDNNKWLIVIFLLNPFTIWAALEIRLYAFLLFLSTITVYYFLRYFLENKNKYLYLLLFTSLLGLYTQHFFAVLLASFALSLLVFKGWKICIKFCLYSLPIVFLFLPNLWIIPDQMMVAESQKTGFTFLYKFINVFLYSPKELFLGLDGVLFSNGTEIVIVSIFILLILFSYYKWYSKICKTHFELFNVSMFIAGCTMIIISIIFASAPLDFHDRYLAIVFPLLMIVFVLFKILSPTGRNLIFGIISLIFTFMGFMKYRNLVKTYDYNAVAHYISKIERKNEPILFYHSTVSLPFKFYYNGKNPIKPLPHDVHFDLTFQTRIKDTTELKRSIESINTRSKSFLMVSDMAEEIYKNDKNRNMVNNYIYNNYYIELDTLYFGRSKTRPLRIRRFEKKIN